MKMYALTYCYEGCYNTTPYAATIAVSTNKELLREKMWECIEEDCVIPDDEDDLLDDSQNYEVYKELDDEVVLIHREDADLYAKYHITSVDVLS